MSWLTIILLIVYLTIKIITNIVNHFLACAKFTMICKAFPNESLEEVTKASVTLSSNDECGD